MPRRDRSSRQAFGADDRRCDRLDVPGCLSTSIEASTESRVSTKHSGYWPRRKPRIRMPRTEVEVPSEPMRTLLVTPCTGGDPALRSPTARRPGRALECLRTRRGARRMTSPGAGLDPALRSGLPRRPLGRERSTPSMTSPDVPSALYARGIPPVAEGIERLSTTRAFERVSGCSRASSSPRPRSCASGLRSPAAGSLAWPLRTPIGRSGFCSSSLSR